MEYTKSPYTSRMWQRMLSLPTYRHHIALWLFWIFPQILLVSVCNSRAMGEHSENSDIDLFIITKKGQLWTGRFLVTLISSLLGVRRKNTHGLTKWSLEYIKRTRNKFCLSFFITEDAMNLDSIRIENDMYLDKWIETLIPLVKKDKTLERFWAANSLGKSSEKKETKKSWFILYSLFFILSWLEWIIRKLWLPHTLQTYKKLSKPWWVIISDTVLKFHDNDQRKVYRDSHNQAV